MANEAQVREYKNALEKLGYDARLLADQIERLIALRDAEWATEDIAIITWSGEARRGALGMDKLRLALDKLGRTQADNYRAIRENK